jgi:D-alanyl-D-alanine dipeptidase
MKQNLYRKILLFMSFFSTISILPHKKENDLLVNIKDVDASIMTDIIYATDKNFTHHIIYNSSVCLLRKEVAYALAQVQKELNKIGIGLKIWDGFRPLSAQWKLWEICPDEKYVSDPRKGGRHTRGTAVDVTLVDLRTGKELAMPTGFDDFTEKAWLDYQNISEEVKKNRQLLQDAMHKYGFTGIKTEWWHFDYNGWQNYEPLDLELPQQ